MAQLLDIEKTIKRPEIDSRFRLVNIVTQRAREVNSDREGVLPLQAHDYDKVTTNALEEIIENKVKFIEENPEEA